MRIEVRGRHVEVTDDLREAVIQRFARVGKQVSELATLEVELREEKNPRISDRMVAEATLHLKGVTLRAKEASPDMLHSIHEIGRGHPPAGEEAPREAPQAAADPQDHGATARRDRPEQGR